MTVYREMGISSTDCLQPLQVDLLHVMVESHVHGRIQLILKQCEFQPMLKVT